VATVSDDEVRIDRDALIAVAVGVMKREGGSPAQWHRWRCEYPERYGPCDCDRGVAEEIITAVVARVADAIEAEVPTQNWAGNDEMPQNVVRAVVRLVRSFGGEQ
jgi:hypothetical protein